MKLNLLPATVNKGAAARTAWIGAVVLILAGAGVCAFMIVTSGQQLRDIKQQVADARPKAQEALDTSAMAETVVNRAAPYVRNRKLAQAMIAHNAKYPKLFNDVRSWIPSFFRVTQMSAQPNDASTATVTLVGTLDNYQQYADLMLVFLRNEEVAQVGRANYVPDEQIVPPLTPVDQVGRPRLPNEAPVPDDPLERLAYFQAQGSTLNYTGYSNFGTGTQDARLALPDSSLITVTLVVNRDLTVPDVRGTLSGAGGAAPVGGGAPVGLGGGGGLPPSDSDPEDR
jgi:hypothetical protein